MKCQKARDRGDTITTRAIPSSHFPQNFRFTSFSETAFREIRRSFTQCPIHTCWTDKDWTALGNSGILSLS